MQTFRLKRNFLCIVILFSTLAYSQVGFGLSEDACRRLSSRLQGISPSPAQMTSCKAENDVYAAALLFTTSDRFLAEVKDVFAVTGNEDGDYLQPLTDYTATIMGFARDDLDYREALYGDIFYTCEGGTQQNACRANGQDCRQYANENNNHYEDCEADGRYQGLLKQESIKARNTIFAVDDERVPAGIYTTAGWGCMVYEDGTNRAALRWTLAHHMGEVIDKFADGQVPDEHVRRDVTRAPGGNPDEYKAKCKTCHAGMDALADAWAYNDCNIDAGNGTRELTYSLPSAQANDSALEQAVVPKYSNNANTSPDGHVTKNDNWENRWNFRANTRVGWNFPENEVFKAKGPKAFGKMISETDQFLRATAQRVYRKTCLVEEKLHESAVLKDLVTSFKADGYSLRKLFARSAAKCATPKK